MPELPEVETIVNDLNEVILNKKIKKVEILLSKIIRGTNKNFCATLENNSFQKISRWGKFIIIQLSLKNKYLVVHLRMSGQIIYYMGKDKIIVGGHNVKNNQLDLPNKQTHLIIYFSDNSKLFYNDQRQFGYWQVVNPQELKEIQNRLGLNPLSAEFTLSSFQESLENKRGSIKAFLLNQKYIAGLGNIYTDECLFEARVLPFRKTNTLSAQEIEKLYKAIKDILNLAIQYRGTTFSDYVDAKGHKGTFIKLLKVYRREGQECFRCSKGIIKKVKIAGRWSRYCPYCQK